MTSPLGYEALAEKHGHAPGGFNATIDALEIPGELELSMIIRRVCRERTVWPEQLFGFERARMFTAAAREDVAPLATGRCERPSTLNYVVFARRLIWRAAYARTDLSVENIAELFGYSAGTVRPWAMSWKPFEKEERPLWWHFWGPMHADLIGVPLDESDPVAEAEAITAASQ